MQDGVPVNDDEGLEQDTEEMGVKAGSMKGGMHDSRPDPNGVSWRKKPVKVGNAGMHRATSHPSSAWFLTASDGSVQRYKDAAPSSLSVFLGKVASGSAIPLRAPSFAFSFS